MAGQQKRQAGEYFSGGPDEDTAYPNPKKPYEQEPADKKFIPVEADDQFTRHDDLGDKRSEPKDKK
jgi:hypothetical protein